MALGRVIAETEPTADEATAMVLHYTPRDVGGAVGDRTACGRPQVAMKSGRSHRHRSVQLFSTTVKHHF